MKLDSMEKMALSLPFYICSLFLSLLLYSSATLDPIPLATAPIARASATLESPRVSSEPPETARGSEEEAFFDVEAGLSVGAPLGALGGLRAGAWPLPRLEPTARPAAASSAARGLMARRGGVEAPGAAAAVDVSASTAVEVEVEVKAAAATGAAEEAATGLDDCATAAGSSPPATCHASTARAMGSSS